jgi:phosphoglycerol geranylgeranyltransferase
LSHWVESYLIERIRKNIPLHLTLIDPEKTKIEESINIARVAEEVGSSGILVGGSTVSSIHQLDGIIKNIKNHQKIPVILFPNGIAGISKYADAIFFSSLLNSINPYYITGAQALGAPLVIKHGIEPIPIGYIIVGEGGAAGFIGQAKPIPYNKPELAAIYAMAAQLLGMHMVYLEAGSGADFPIPPDMIKKVKKSIDIPLIVGGGIRSKKEAKLAVKSGADIIVTGNIVENVSLKKLKSIVSAIDKI